MTLKSFLKDKTVTIVIKVFFLYAVIYTLWFFAKLDEMQVLFIAVLIFAGDLLLLLYEYFRKASFYKKIDSNLCELEDKYLISEIIHEPDFLEGKILYNTLKMSFKSMSDNIAKYKKESKSYREYIETWIHEVKTPLSSIYLMLENNYSELNENILDELGKIEGFIEQVLYYSRSQSVEKDFFIKKVNLNKIVDDAIKKNSRYLIQRQIKRLYNKCWGNK